ncbi:MAG: hypothetical protein HKN47_27325 [Pirellulaceae bacterium]|nr:hypothetical protein [Pirellulaceae bacterium]
MIPLYRPSIIMAAFLFGGAQVCADDLKFNDYRSAMSAGVGIYRSGNLAASQSPLESAVELAKTDRERVEAYSLLIKVFAEADSYDKMFDAAEYVVEHAPYPAKASLTVRSLISNCHRKNQLEAFTKRYESLLANDPDHRTALTMLAAYYQNAVRDFGKRAEYLKRLIDLDQSQNKEPDAELMADYAFAMKLAGNYQQAAEFYESTAPLNEELQSSCYMEAADAWDKAGRKAKSLADAHKAHDIGPDKRAKRSLYRWHRTLGEIFLSHQAKDEALHHFQAALESAPIEAYKKQVAELIEKTKSL